MKMPEVSENLKQLARILFIIHPCETRRHACETLLRASMMVTPVKPAVTLPASAVLNYQAHVDRHGLHISIKP